MRGLPAGDIVLTKSGGGRIRVSPAVIITRVIQDMGQFPYQNPEPTGYPDRSDFWMSGWSVWNRTKFAVSLMNNEIVGTTVDASQLSTASKQNTREAALAELMAPAALAAKKSSPHSGPDALNAFVLALGSPEFQQK
jgi:uncharacterized protein (DUF1800 family)